jgi:hypothetical protein
MGPFLRGKIELIRRKEWIEVLISRMNSTLHHRMPKNNIFAKFLFFKLVSLYLFDLKGSKTNQYVLYYELDTELKNRVFFNWNKTFAR